MLYASNSHPIIKQKPPMGVIAPNHLKLVNTKRRSEPEKIITPKVIKYAGIETNFSVK